MGKGKSGNGNMDQTEKDTLLMVADYSSEEKGKLLKRIHASLLSD